MVTPFFLSSIYMHKGGKRKSNDIKYAQVNRAKLMIYCRSSKLNQNKNCYWWHVQMTIIHQHLWWGKLVPSPYKRSELSKWVCSFSSRKESICKWIPISNSLWEEAALVNVNISKGGMKCQRVVISDMPNCGDKVIRRYTGCTLQTFVKHYDSTISPPFCQRFQL